MEVGSYLAWNDDTITVVPKLYRNLNYKNLDELLHLHFDKYIDQTNHHWIDESGLIKRIKSFKINVSVSLANSDAHVHFCISENPTHFDFHDISEATVTRFVHHLLHDKRDSKEYCQMVVTSWSTKKTILDIIFDL
jgi:hypothetical protein